MNRPAGPTAPARPLQYLTCEVVQTTDELTVLEWLASTRAAQHAAALAEAQQLLDWARQHHGAEQGPAEEGGAWDHDLQVQAEADGWHSVALTLTCRPDIAEACLAAFGADGADDSD